MSASSLSDSRNRPYFQHISLGQIAPAQEIRFMASKLSGTDGIGGQANIHPMTAEIALKVGMTAVAARLRKGTRRHGYDDDQRAYGRVGVGPEKNKYDDSKLRYGRGGRLRMFAAESQAGGFALSGNRRESRRRDSRLRIVKTIKVRVT